MASSKSNATEAEAAKVARTYFGAIAARDPEAAAASYAPGAVDRLVGMTELRAPDGVRDWFGRLFAAVPDFSIEILDLVSEGEQAAVRWRSRGTFDGTGSFEGVSPTGATLEVEGFDLLTVRDGRIVSNQAYVNGLDLARQMGVMPAAGSLADRAMLAGTNARTAALGRIRGLLER
jgi:predicted ester cyclase